MKVWVAKQSQKYAWHTAGDEIKYRISKVGRNGGYSTRCYSCLSFTYTLPKNNKDKIYFAYSIPYTFSKLTNFLKSVNLQHKDSDFLKETILCKSLSGIPVPLLTITSRVHSDPTGYNLIKLEEFQDAESKVSIPFNKKKRYAVISGRVHPGECPSSWMMQGFLKCLMGDSLQAK
jgi:cytosolic carboxypeptidase protein 2/3